MVDGRYNFEFPDEAGYPDGTGFLSEDQKVLIDQVIAPDKVGSDIAFIVVKDARGGSYQAISGDAMLGEITFSTDGDRVTLIATTVFDEFKRHGVATELIRRVLDTLQDEGKTVTIVCPIVRTFINRNPEYELVVDPDYPGVRNSRK
jgi:predicted GNAT family acetyltransferase